MNKKLFVYKSVNKSELKYYSVDDIALSVIIRYAHSCVASEGNIFQEKYK